MQLRGQIAPTRQALLDYFNLNPKKTQPRPPRMSAHIHAKFISCSRVVICEFDVENGLRVVEHLLDSFESDCLLAIGLHDLYDDLNLALRPDHWDRQLKSKFRP